MENYEYQIDLKKYYAGINVKPRKTRTPVKLTPKVMKRYIKALESVRDAAESLISPDGSAHRPIWHMSELEKALDAVPLLTKEWE